MTREALFQYAKKCYGVIPDHPWMDDPISAVLRHADTKKWFGLVLRISTKQLGLTEDIKIDVLNAKADPAFISFNVGRNGIYRAYHMNKQHWITVRLDEAPDDVILMVLDQSFAMTEKTAHR